MSADVTPAEVERAAGLFTTHALQSGKTALHRVADAGAATMAEKSWQAGLSEAVQLAVDKAARAGLNVRGRRRAALRADQAYRRKHPKP